MVRDTYRKERKMATPQELQIDFDLDIKRSESKIANPTRNLMMSILEEAGFTGSWGVRDSRRIKKKGRERFKAIRLESRGGRIGIRVWCKPRGNDTCFEYSLIPPFDVNIQEAFALLSRVNGVTLKIPESAVLPLAWAGRMLDVPPFPIVPAQIEKITDVEDDEQPSDPMNEDSEEIQQPCESADGDSEDAKFQSLWLSSDENLSSDNSMDKALVAVGFVTIDGYCDRRDAFESMERHLNLKGYKGNDWVPSAVRSLIASMKDIGLYLRRVRKSPKDRKARLYGEESTVGFEITKRGQERLYEIRSSYGSEVEARLGLGWRSRFAPAESSPERTSVVRSEVASTLVPDAVARIKGLVASYEEAAGQVKEYDEVISPIAKEMSRLEVEIGDLCVVESDLAGRIAEIQRQLDEVRLKKEKAEGDLDKKRSEKTDWEKLKAPHESEMTRLGALLSGLGGIK